MGKNTGMGILWLAALILAVAVPAIGSVMALPFTVPAIVVALVGLVLGVVNVKNVEKVPVLVGALFLSLVPFSLGLGGAVDGVVGAILLGLGTLAAAVGTVVAVSLMWEKLGK